MQEMLKDVLMTIIYLGIVTLIPTLIYGIKKCAEALIEYLGIKSDKTTIDTILSEITQFVSNSVTYVMQTYVDSIKKDGKFDKDAQRTAFTLAYNSAMELIPKETKELFENIYGSLDDYLKILIESEVKKLKQQENAASDTTSQIKTEKTE